MNIDNESNLLNKKIVYDLTPFTQLDYPEHLACIVWMSGCNLRCGYCYNKDIVFSKKGKLCLKDVLDFLEKRVGLLDAVVLSGGEASRYIDELFSFCKEVKKRGFKIKLDTNGIEFENVKKLVESKMLDFISLDYKAPKERFFDITKFYEKEFGLFRKTLKYLIKKEFPFEVRTTLHSDLLSEDDINHIIEDLLYLGYKNTYYIQLFLPTQTTIDDISLPQKEFDFSKLNKDISLEIRKAG